MKVSEKQLLILIDILRDSLPLANHFSISQENRFKLYEQLLKQQDETLKEIGE